ncbi:MAG: cob(I)yrinic acid a,c-diamide adenosyltransferase [Bacteroidales bacterium]|jgi:cob(I)alamin adenosyltransferase|nr:cob(I)yrinic acid a,c-diamide adenosyltransferase [Bacteroidales bacterium]MDD3273490.1 cob(I)yrinic acid a,c-diamide adenosyltransferase [Bacteroidales bacterium]MDD4058389.1 cob(I)yrinic acid a,c-diamide adenosyltransferase [Bacteroidales bacterium]
MKREGLVHVYTGDGKGKTTSAIGLAVRALGCGMRVCYVSFHKRPELYGYTEMESIRKLGATVINIAKGHPHLDKTIDNEEITKEVNEGLLMISKLIKDNNYDLLILDEIIISVRDNYLEERSLLSFIKEKPYSLELVLTGRAATEAIMDSANYVSFIKKIKHPYDNGVTSRKGVEY